MFQSPFFSHPFQSSSNASLEVASENTNAQIPVLMVFSSSNSSLWRRSHILLSRVKDLCLTGVVVDDFRAIFMGDDQVFDSDCGITG